MDDARPAATRRSLGFRFVGIVRKMLAIGVDAVLLVISIYIMWGWITIQDIQIKARDRGLDADEVIEWLATPPYWNITFSEKTEKGTTSQATIQERAASRVLRQA